MYIVNLYNVTWKKKYTYNDIEEGTGLSRATVSHLFSGEYHDYQLSTLETVSKFFKCSIHDILIEVEDK